MFVVFVFFFLKINIGHLDEFNLLSMFNYINIALYNLVKIDNTVFVCKDVYYLIQSRAE